jgi:cellulose synthase/poly-beta-1,6-N-acetylglucosamine synthase-like glycosyltransferase
MNLYQWWWLLFSVFCTITLTQLFYYLFFFSRLSLYKPGIKTVSHTHPVSVIVCARDEAANLARNLPGILVQQYPTTHEVLVVDDNSFDDTRYLLEALQKEFRQLQVVELKQEAKLIPGKKFPLSVGIRTAKHEVVLLTDADCVPASEHWINRMQEAYTDDTEIVLGYGAYHKKKGYLNRLIRWETFHTALQYLSYALAGMPYMGVGRNLSYKKTVFTRHKGFSAHNHIPSGDDDLFINMAAHKQNTRICIDPDSFTLSVPATTWAKWVKQKRRHYSTGRHYKPLHKALLGAYSLSHFLYYPFLLVLGLLSGLPQLYWVLGVLGLRLLVQALVLIPALKKLGERDLIPWIPLLDVWMFFYYAIFAIALIQKPKRAWN